MTRTMIVALAVAASATASAPVHVETLVTCSNALIIEATSDAPNADLEGAAAQEMQKDCPVGYDVVGKQLEDDGRHLSLEFVCRISVAQAEPLKTCGKETAGPSSSN
jgi:hypothetical protein